MRTREQLQDRIEELEELLGIDQSTTGRLRAVLKLEPMHSEILGMLMKRGFVTRDGLYTVLYGDRPECEWPDEKILDVQICKLRAFLKKQGHEINIVTKWGTGWELPRAEKAKIKALIDRPDADGLPVVTDAPPLAPAGSVAERRLAFLEGR